MSMTPAEAMQQRHAVRRYTDTPIPADIITALQVEIDECNREGNLHIQLVCDEPEAFTSGLAHYGKFSGVKNYLALIGKKGSDLDERLGYYGERVVLEAQRLGLNSCWVALTFSRKKCPATIDAGEKLVCVIALGYGATQGATHKSKPLEELCHTDGDMPAWFAAGMEAALLAPTAVNQQKFLITLVGTDGVKAVTTGGTFSYSRVDLGIVHYHFEIGAGVDSFHWVD